jgi:hypothetical protein
MATLFLASFFVTAIFGIGLLFVPAALLEPFGVTINNTAALFARLFGSALISLAIILSFTKNSKSFKLKQGVIYGLFTYYLLSTILLCIARLTHLVNGLGWSLVALHAIFTLWFGAYLFTKETQPPKKSARQKADRAAN